MREKPPSDVVGSKESILEAKIHCEIDQARR
jgi:hypothetical protein